MKALYRRYRPKTLEAVVGQSHITDVLKKSIKNGSFSHAYLFAGPRGTGKTSVARIFAHLINDFEYELEDNYLDIIEIDGASNRGIDDIRELRERANIAPTKGKYKVYIIDEVHMLTREAFNALLKTLEEPPAHVIFIMATTDVQKVPITITSRSQVFTFRLADPSTMLEHVKSICKEENILIDDDALKIVIKRGGGSFRDTLSLLDQVATLSDQTITAELLNTALGLPQDTIIEELLAAYTAGDLDSIRKSLIELTENGIKPEVIANELINSIMANPEPVYLPLLSKLVDAVRHPISNADAKLLLALCANQVSAPRQFAPTAPAAPKKPTFTKPEPKPAAEPTPEPAPEPKPAPAVRVSSDASASEIWQSILANFQEKAHNDLTQIKNADYVLKENKLTIYSKNKFAKLRLEQKREYIAEVLPDNIVIEITDEVLASDPEMANIAELMGGGEEITIDE